MLKAAVNATRTERRRSRSPEEVNAEFEDLLERADGAAQAGRGEVALDHCWSARRLAKRNGLERVGEADLAIGVRLLDLDRMNESLEAVYRSVRYFAHRGQLYLRGCAEALLAEAALRRDDEPLASRHLRVAGDLLVTGSDRRCASEVLAIHAARLAASGRGEDAERVSLVALRLRPRPARS